MSENNASEKWSKSKIHILEEIIEFVEDILDDQKDTLPYDRAITYNNMPNLYKKCPHCDCKGYDHVEEVLEDAVMKVKCSNCENYFYIFFGK